MAVAQGKLVPLTYVKIVQPAEAGIVEKILVKEGQEVQAGQILMRMDTKLADADSKAVLAEYQRRTIQLRRIDAEMANQPLVKQANDPDALYLQAESQYRVNRQAYQDAIGQEQALLEKAREERSQMMREAKEMRDKIIQDAKEQARKETNKIVADAQSVINQQKMAAITDLKNQVGNLVLEVSEKVLRRELNNKEEQEKYIQQLAQNIELN